MRPWPAIARSSRLATLLLMAGGLVATWVWPSTIQATPQASFDDALEVRLIEIHAVAEGRGGERLTGLTTADFRIWVDEKPQTPDYLTEITTQQREVGGFACLVFIDDYFALPSQRDAALNRLRADLKEWHPNDPMSIVAYDGKRLEVLLPWTTEVAAMEAALVAAKKRPAYGLHRRSEAGRSAAYYRRWTEPSNGSVSTIGFSGASRGTPPNFELIHELVDRIARVGSAAAVAGRQFLEGDAPPAARRAMVILAGGLPADPAALTGLAAARDPIVGRVAPALEGRKLFAPLIQVANRYGFSVFPIDLSQTSGATLAGSAFPGFSASSALRSAGAELQQISADLYAEVASATGGSLLLGGGGDAVARLRREGEAYYRLGLAGRWAADDREHPIRIEVRRPGAKIRARQSLFAASAATHRDWEVDALLMLNRPFDSPRGLVVSSEPIEGDRRANQNLKIELAPDLLAWASAPGNPGASRRAKVEIRVAGRDAFGDELSLPRQVVELVEPTRGAPAVFEQALHLPRRDYQVLVAVYDAASGRLMARKIEVHP